MDVPIADFSHPMHAHETPTAQQAPLARSNVVRHAGVALLTEALGLRHRKAPRLRLEFECTVTHGS